jgi:hypothetical protein
MFRLPPAGTVNSAPLRPYGRLSSIDEPQVVTTVYGVADTSWQPSTLTWNTRPAGGTAIGMVTVTGTTPAWVQLNVTGYVQSEAAAGRQSVTIALKDLNAPATWGSFAWSEAGGNAPQLVIR